MIFFKGILVLRVCQSLPVFHHDMALQVTFVKRGGREQDGRPIKFIIQVIFSLRKSHVLSVFVPFQKGLTAL